MSNLMERFGRKAIVGDVLFREGERGQALFVIQAGKVRLTRLLGGEAMTLAELGTGEVFGEMSIINDKPRTATATVIEDAQLLVLDPRTFEAMIKANTEIAVRMVKKLARRLDEANSQIENLLLRDDEARVAHALLQLAGKESVSGGAVRLSRAAQEIGRCASMDSGVVLTHLSRLEQDHMLSRDGDDLVLTDLGRLQALVAIAARR